MHNRIEAAGGDGANALGDRLPPQNLEAERMVLSACLMDPIALDDVLLMLRPEDFYRQAHEIAFRTLKDLRDSGAVADAVALADELERRGEYHRIGGDDLLTEIAGAAPHSANARYHADIVRQKAVMRRLIQASADTIRDGYSNLYTASEMISSAESRIFAIGESQCSDSTTGAETFIGETMLQIQGRQQRRGPGVTTGFPDVDFMIDSLRPEEFVIVAGRPSMGKTAFAVQVAVQAALENKQRSLIVSLETGRHALAERMISSHAAVDSMRLRRAWEMGSGELQAIHNAAAVLSQGDVAIDDAPSRTVSQIAANGRRMKRRGGLDLIVIDYLQLIDDERQKGDSRHEGIARISRRLKATARELGVPIVALSQLNRGVENRTGAERRPRLSDLRESGQIEQDADSVILIHRPDYYDSTDQPGIAEIIVAKNRNGPTGTARLCFRKHCTRFDSLAHGERPPADGQW